MNTPDQDILGDVFERTQRRRALLPLWIKICIWIFFVFAAFTPLIFIIGLMGGNAELALFGLSTNDPASLTGIIIMAIFLFKGLVSYFLWTEKSYGVNVAVIDAILSIVICAALMIYAFSNGRFTLRLELVPLYFYLKKMSRIRKEWEAEYVLQEQPATI